MKISLPPSDNVLANFSTQNNQQPAASTTSSTGFSVTQKHLIVEQTINDLLKNLTASIQTRESLINSLPNNLKEATLKIIQETAATSDKFPQGIGTLASGQKAAVDKVFKLVTAIKDAQLIKGSISLDLLQLQAFDEFWSPLAKVDTALSKLLTDNNFFLLANYINENPNLKQLLTKAFRNNLLENQSISIKELFALFTKNAPENLVAIAEKNKLPELVLLWAGIKLRNALPWLDMNMQQAHKSSDILQQLAASLHPYIAGGEEAGTPAANYKLFSMTLPLYFENNPKPYPAYIHVYQDAKDDPEQLGQQSPETWLRICLSTENIGFVDTVFRLYQGNLINIRLAFSSNSAADIFTEYLPEIETHLANSTLKLTAIKVK